MSEPRSLYRELGHQRRLAAVVAELAASQDWREQLVRRLVLRGGGFRPETIRQWPPRKLAREVVTGNLETADEAINLVRCHYVNVEPAIQAEFLRLTDVPSDGATITASGDGPLTSAEMVGPAARALVTAHGDDGLHYLRCLAAFAASRWPGIGGVVTSLLTPTADLGIPEVAVQIATAPDPVELAPADGVTPSRIRPPGVGQLTTLDDVVTVATINAANEVDGALTPANVRALIAELVNTNGQRHQSWYSAGLADILIGDGVVSPGSTHSDGGRKWFLAGQIVGLVRMGRQDEVLAKFDRDALCRALGRNGSGACAEAAPHIFRALWAAERFADAIAFLSPTAVAECGRVADQLLQSASGLLALRDPANARPALDLMREGLQLREYLGLPVDQEVVRTVERRQAHCRRLAGEFEAARTILQPLIADEDEDVGLRSMMVTDCALMDAGYRELGQLRLPKARTDADAMARGLGAVSQQLRDAVALDVDGAAHARYALGMLQLLHECGGDARRELEAALTAFRARPDVYTRHGLLAQAELHHALALCLEGGSRTTVVAAAQALMKSTTDELQIPDWMLESVLTSVSAADGAVAKALFEVLVEQRGEDIVPQLARLVDEIPGIATAFLARAGSTDLSVARRLESARLALTGLVKHSQLDEADEALEILLNAGIRGAGTGETIALLRDDDDLTRVRDPEDLQVALAELHLAAGDAGAGAGILARLAAQMLARSEPWERAEAAEAIERLAELPGYEERVAELRTRLERAEGRLEAPVAPPAKRGVHLLVVGGNELQARYEVEIREILRREAKHISVEFIPTGWSSNWGPVADDVSRRLKDADGMVLHYFIRTMFGRKVRKAAKVWCAVGGHGRDGILRGIYRCAEMAVRRDGPRDG